MDFSNSIPIYQQIIEEFKKQIVRGEITRGDKICSQREYAANMRINPNTVQRAYREMENMKIVETVRGQGTFVIADERMREALQVEMAEKILALFVTEMRSLGYTGGQMQTLLRDELEKNKEERRDDRI